MGASLCWRDGRDDARVDLLHRDELLHRVCLHPGPGGQRGLALLHRSHGGGVVTSWSHNANASAGAKLKLKVYRPTADPDNFTVVGQSQFENLVPSQLNVFPTRIPVQVGDVLAYTRAASSSIRCFSLTGGVGDLVRDAPGFDDLDGATTTLNPAATAELLNIAAVLEPDADHDNFGDETQDQCPTDASIQESCPKAAAADTTAPTTTITKRPPKLIETDRRKAKVKFSFGSDEPGSSFKCKLDNKPYKPCGSPKTYRIKATESPKKHTFRVRAIDAAGNVDPTPAKRSFKVRLID
jgi:hypothetical protein